MDEELRQALQAVLQPVQDAQRQRAEEVRPDDSYWYYRPQRNFPPPLVRLPDEYDGGERLSLGITQTGLTPAKQKALVREWCALLPTLANVRTLWFHSKVTQEMLEAACAMPALEGLYVKWSGITSLAPLAGLPRLAYFHLGSAPSAEGLEALATLPGLVDLEISNVRAAADLRFVEGLAGLRALSVSGDSNSIKPLNIPNLAPLACLHALERLTLSTVRVENPSLAPLAGLAKLKYLRLSNAFPMEEVAWLAGRRPDIHCDSFQPTSGPVQAFGCKQCGQKTMVMTTGKGKAWLCQHCDAARLEKHVAAFEALVKAAAAG